MHLTTLLEQTNEKILSLQQNMLDIRWVVDIYPVYILRIYAGHWGIRQEGGAVKVRNYLSVFAILNTCYSWGCY